MLLWGSVCWGLLLSTRVGQTTAPPRALNDAHQYLSELALGFTLFHALVLRLHLDLWGVLAALMLAAVWLSSRWRKRLGNIWWRRLHYAGFVAFLGAAVHGLSLGQSSPTMHAFYLLTVGVVVLLTIYRLAVREPSRPARTRSQGESRVHPAG
jgi:DMSO/TMAO reductase YedYZ heme-binding membrane subunit